MMVPHGLTATGSAAGDASKAIWQGSVYEFDSLHDLLSAPHIYRRYGCPNSDDLAASIASLEGAESGFATSSGMGAIVAATMSNCKSGDLIIVNSGIYGATYEFFNVDMRRLGADVILEDVFDVNVLEKILKDVSGYQRYMENDTSQRKVMVFLESITNPLVKVANILCIAETCKKYGATLVVDNTMATPLRMKPILEGATLVIHSVTKYLGGHDDLMAGVIVGFHDHIDRARSLATRWGLIATPFDAWLAVRGLHTLQISSTGQSRMERSLKQGKHLQWWEMMAFTYR